MFIYPACFHVALVEAFALTALHAHSFSDFDSSVSNSNSLSSYSLVLYPHPLSLRKAQTDYRSLYFPTSYRVINNLFSYFFYKKKSLLLSRRDLILFIIIKFSTYLFHLSGQELAPFPIAIRRLPRHHRAQSLRLS